MRVTIKTQLRDTLLARMERDHKHLEGTIKSLTGGELNGWSNIVNKSFREFQGAQKDACNECQRPAELEAAMVVADRADTLHVQTLALIESARESLAAERPKVPRISEIILPKFNGDATEWVEWRSQFEVKVLNTPLPAGDKIDLLLSSLIGNAKNTAGKAGTRSQEELLNIWGKLVLNYDNPYQQVYAHICSITQMPNIETPSPESYRDLINVVEEQLRLLSNYKVSSENWGAVLCVILLHKLDTHSLYLWSTSPDKPTLPNLEALFKFLRQRSRALEDARAAKTVRVAHPPSNQGSNDAQRTQDFRKNANRHSGNGNRREESKPYFRPSSNRQCYGCGNAGHLLPACDKFNKMSPKDKSAVVSDHQLCPKCLRYRISIPHDCVRGACRHCNNPSHNSLICDKAIVSRQSN